jgi:hypothetical protein
VTATLLAESLEKGGMSDEPKRRSPSWWARFTVACLLGYLPSIGPAACIVGYVCPEWGDAGTTALAPILWASRSCEPLAVCVEIDIAIWGVGAICVDDGGETGSI